MPSGIERFQKTPLKALFVEELESIYWIENHLLKSLPSLRETTNSNETRQAYKNHLKSIEENIKRLKKIYDIIGLAPKGRKSNPALEILNNCKEVIAQTPEGGMAREAGLLIYGQKLAHYKTACYSALATMAKTIQLDDVPALLKITIQEEKAMATLLYSIGESHINLSDNEELNV